ncbi:MAG: DUF3267 domain-containing protein [Clostridia bacterium]|nr:DUF3267 domain-containing protein [Clostridia bacterium]
MHYYKELPEGYINKYVIDAKRKKDSLLLSLFSILLFGWVAVILLLVRKISFIDVIRKSIEQQRFSTIMLLIAFILFLFIYFILHELIHGLFYKLFTHQKLTFGFTLTVAFCGVPEIYCDKLVMLVTILAPFTVFFAIFLPLSLILPPDSLACLLSIVFLGVHVGGCVGDLFGAFILLRSPKDVLVNDTGAKQTFYVKEEIRQEESYEESSEESQPQQPEEDSKTE